MNVRMAGCRACEQITSGDCGMHGPLFIPSGVVAGAAPAQEPTVEIREILGHLCNMQGEYPSTCDAIRNCLKRLAATSAGAAPEQVTRFEVIDEKGRQYTRWDCSVELSYQDGGRTLKVFVK